MNETPIHICLDYQQTEGLVFVDDRETDWRSVPVAEVQPTDHVIRCSCCKSPAIVLDHFYPYGVDRNRCAEHRNQDSGWKIVKSGYWHYFRNHHSACWRYETEYSGGGLPEPGAKVCEMCRQRWARDVKRAERAKK